MKRITCKEIDLPLVAQIETFHSRTAQRISWHSHPGHELIFFLDGSTVYEFPDGRLIEVRGGHFLVVPPRIVHRGVENVRTPSTICALRLNPGFAGGCTNTVFNQRDLEWMNDQLMQSGLTIHQFSADLKRVLQWLMQEISGFETDPGDPPAKTNLRMWACATLFGAVRELRVSVSTQPEELVDAAKDYLHKNLGAPLRMPDLIKHIGLGRSRLFAIFKSATGMTPNDYLLRLRVAQAQKLLADPLPSVTTIALATGFSSCQYFDNVFRKYTGQTPAEYRRGTRRTPPIASHAKERVAHPAAPATKGAKQKLQ